MSATSAVPILRQAPSREAISIQDAAIILGVCEKTLRNWKKRGIIEMIRIGPKLLRIPRDEIARLRRQRAR